MHGIRTFPSLSDAMHHSYEAYDRVFDTRAGEYYWLMRVQTARGWAFAIAFEQDAA
jgi:hypothetical protein